MDRRGPTPSRGMRTACGWNHHADPNKSRAQYLPLLELAVQEDPTNDRNMHYLGREYMFRQDWDRCIATLLRHLDMPNALWADERCASMRFLGKAYAYKGEGKEARRWYHRAIAEAPQLREPYLDFAVFLSQSQEWEGVLWLAQQALAITERPKSYICEGDAWGYLPHDLLALALYRLNRPKEALGTGKNGRAAGPLDRPAPGQSPLLCPSGRGGPADSKQKSRTQAEIPAFGFLLARLSGLEPEASGLGGSRSILLSYRRMCENLPAVSTAFGGKTPPKKPL